jgi:GDP/UDP-N,N'-diacetylbacillosamine 2-epimerase (hydrolysing)
MNKKICIVTATRAEYGIYRPLLKRLSADPSFKIQLVVTGTHLSHLYGFTYKEIEKDGFNIDLKIKIPVKNKSHLDVADSASEALHKIAKAFQKLQPDLVMLLGDRYEMLASAFAAHLSHVPVAHIHGGEVTEGSLDDSMRHAITKLSKLHFASTEKHRQRIIQLGEMPQHIYNVGSLGVENIKTLKLLSRAELELKLKIKINKPFAVVTLHPATNENVSTLELANNVFNALRKVKELNLLITYPNADEGSNLIIKAIKKFNAEQGSRVKVVESLGALNYLSLLKYSNLVIGNSSSGVIEAPSFRIPVINIGNRQQSRITARNVIHSSSDEADIIRSIKKGLSRAFVNKAAKAINPYENGKASVNILKALKKYKNFSSIEKKFHDI